MGGDGDMATRTEEHEGTPSVGEGAQAAGRRACSDGKSKLTDEERREQNRRRRFELMPSCTQLLRGTFLRLLSRFEKRAKQRLCFLRREASARKASAGRLRLKSSTQETRLQQGDAQQGTSVDSEATSTAAIRASNVFARLNAVEARRRQRALLPDWVVRSLDRRQRDRTSAEIDAIVPVLRASSWMDQLPPEVLSADGGLRALVSAIKVRCFLSHDRLPCSTCLSHCRQLRDSSTNHDAPTQKGSTLQIGRMHRRGGGLSGPPFRCG